MADPSNEIDNWKCSCGKDNLYSWIICNKRNCGRSRPTNHSTILFSKDLVHHELWNLSDSFEGPTISSFYYPAPFNVPVVTYGVPYLPRQVDRSGSPNLRTESIQPDSCSSENDEFPTYADVEVRKCFWKADRNRIGFIDRAKLESELLSYSAINNNNIEIGTANVLIDLFTSNNNIGRKEFASIFSSLQKWKAIYVKFDTEMTGRISIAKLKDALMYLEFHLYPKIVQMLIQKFNGPNNTIKYDGFIKCCIVVKGLTEKFKKMDTGCTGLVTFSSLVEYKTVIMPFMSDHGHDMMKFLERTYDEMTRPGPTGLPRKPITYEQFMVNSLPMIG